MAQIQGAHLRRDDASASASGGPAAGSGSPLARAFAIAALVLLALPFAGMPFFSGAADAEKRDETPFPQAMVEGVPNAGFFSQLDAWYSDHFAFRALLVDANATLREKLFMESPVSNVIVGTDGWLYYTGTRADYQRSSPMSDRALDNAAYNLMLMQENAERAGASFVFTIAPNKNSIYPEHMPYFEVPGEGPSNAQRIEPLLQRYGVRYVNLFDAISSDGRVLYLRGDSHWTNEGALVGARALADALGHDLGAYEDAAPQTDAHIGDLAEMLHPTSAGPELQPLWPQSLEFAYANEASSVEDASIQTESTRADARGALMCYRDSFGNALLPYLASAYSTASFSKMVPYDMHPALLRDVDDVVVERAERHLPFFATTPPYMPAPERSLDDVYFSAITATTCFVERSGAYVVIEGTLDGEYAEDGAAIYAAVTVDGETRCYEAFHVSAETGGVADTADESAAGTRIVGDCGYRAYVSSKKLVGASQAEVAIIVCGESGCVSLYRGTHVIGG